MNVITVRPGEIKTSIDDDGELIIIRNIDGKHVRVAVVNSQRKRNRLRIFVWDEKEAYELNWRKIRWR